MATRSQARGAVVEMLYAYSMGNDDIRKFALEILYQKKIKNNQAKFALNLFDGTIKNINSIDKYIKNVLKTWDLNKLGVVDKCIIRLATYEIIYEKLDAAVAINEAIEISKILGSDDTPKFVNGVLDAIVKANNITTKFKKVDTIKLGVKLKDSIESINKKENQPTLKQYPKLCIALDMHTKEENLKLCNLLASHNIKNVYIKIGLRSFIRDGISFINEIKSLGFKIFLDLKLYDIPNTMLDSINEIIKIGIHIITIHISSGRTAMELIANEIKEIKNPPLIFGVTALTSFSNDEFKEIYNDTINNVVENFAKIAIQSKIDGIVCSCAESKIIKNKTDNLLTLTPGIRPTKEEIQEDIYNNIDDQSRIASLSVAKECKSDFVVIGRPIYKSNNPVVITEKIISKLGEII